MQGLIRKTTTWTFHLIFVQHQHLLEHTVDDTEPERERKRERAEYEQESFIHCCIVSKIQCVLDSVFFHFFHYYHFVCVCVDLKMLQFQIPMLSTERIEQKHVSLTT